jgi:hypothetical protein
MEIFFLLLIYILRMSSKEFSRLGVVAHYNNSSALKAEARGSQVPAYPCYIIRPCLKTLPSK